MPASGRESRTGRPNLSRPPARKNRGHRCDTVAHVRNADEAVALDVHLPVVRNVADAAVVGDEGNAVRPNRGSRKAESPRDNRAEAVGANDDCGAVLLGASR